MATNEVDALVIFGATGDLAKIETFPALVGLVQRGVLNVPVIGVAKSGWGLEQFRDYATASLRLNHMDDGSAAAQKMLGLLRYVDGDLSLIHISAARFLAQRDNAIELQVVQQMQPHGVDREHVHGKGDAFGRAGEGVIVAVAAQNGNPSLRHELQCRGMPVSYTHLDVYKRQTTYRLSSSWALQLTSSTEVAGSAPNRQVPAWWATPATGTSMLM